MKLYQNDGKKLLPASRPLQPSSSAFRQIFIAAIIASLVPSAWVAICALDMPQLGRFHDDGLYWVSAKSLADGSGYRILSLPGEPYQTKYPPLYPLLLATIWKLDPNFPQNLRLAVVVCWFALPLCLFLSAGLFTKMGFGTGKITLVCVMLALNPNVLNYSTTMMSELWFLCALVGCLLVVHRAAETSSGLWAALIAGAAGGAAYLTRTAALPLLLTCPLYFVIRRQYRNAAVFAGAMLPAVAVWTCWVNRHILHSDDLISLYYTNYIGFHFAGFTWFDMPVLAWKNVPLMLAGVGKLMAGLRESGILAPIVGFAVLVGTARAARRTGLGPYHFYAAGLIVMVLVWHLHPEDTHGRLLFPAFPLFAAGFYDLLHDGVSKVIQWLRANSLLRTAQSCVLALGIVLLICLTAGGTVAAYLEVPDYLAGQRRDRAHNDRAYRWIETNVPLDGVFLSKADPVLYLHSRRKAFRPVVSPRARYFPGSIERQSLDKFLAKFAREHQVSYVFLHSGTPTPGLVTCGELELLYGAGARICRVAEEVGHPHEGSSEDGTCQR